MSKINAKKRARMGDGSIKRVGGLVGGLKRM